MSAKLMMFMAFGYVVGTFICLIIEGSSFGAAEAGFINNLTVFREVQVFGLWTMPALNIDFFTKGIPKLLMWDYSFLSGGYSMIKWFILWPLSIGAIWGVYQAVIGVISLTRR